MMYCTHIKFNCVLYLAYPLIGLWIQFFGAKLCDVRTVHVLHLTLYFILAFLAENRFHLIKFIADCLAYVYINDRCIKKYPINSNLC